VLTPPSAARFSLTRIGDVPGSSALMKKTARSRSLGHPRVGKLRCAHIAHDDRLIPIDHSPRKLMQGIPSPPRRRAAVASPGACGRGAGPGRSSTRCCGRSVPPPIFPHRSSRPRSLNPNPRRLPHSGPLPGRPEDRLQHTATNPRPHPARSSRISIAHPLALPAAGRIFRIHPLNCLRANPLKTLCSPENGRAAL
jgi:hypothetical protein